MDLVRGREREREREKRRVRTVIEEARETGKSEEENTSRL